MCEKFEIDLRKQFFQGNFFQSFYFDKICNNLIKHNNEKYSLDSFIQFST